MRIFLLVLAAPCLAVLAGCDTASGAFVTQWPRTGGQSVVTAALHQAEIERPAPSSACLPRAVERAPIVAFGAYEGARNLGVRLGDDEHQTTLISVTGSESGDDRILLLMAYEPTIWDFSSAPAERINAVILSGYHNQAVANLPDNVPVIFNMYSDGRTLCGRLGYAYEGGPELDHVVNTITRATGLEVESFDGVYAAHSVVFGTTLRHSETDTIVRSGAIRATVKVTSDAVPPRDRGLATLQSRGIIRPANAQDIEGWNRAATRRLRSGNLASFQSDYLIASRSYVVLAPMTVPAGMYGAHSRNFIIARGVPLPHDRGSHNTYYLADGTCTGVDPECSALGSLARDDDDDGERRAVHD
ncbi:hypothetical protein [Terricaulis silvestris]|uniref:hypothetical protein n=1 Tax=Terricaulis silvestris TaxID=2686094 RepID=UPI00131E1A98|nr:hypothetical protein [Terricaulis silvestris]